MPKFDFGNATSSRLRAVCLLIGVCFGAAACSTANSTQVDHVRPTHSPTEVGFVRTYKVCFDNFTQNQVVAMEDALMGSSNYVSHRTTQSRAKRTCYAYQSGIGQAKLNRNLILLLQREGHNGHVNASGNSFELVNLAKRKRHPTD